MPDHRILLGDLVIFGDFDRPSADMIACVMKIENGVVHGEYLSERSRRLDSRPAGPPESVTLVERFGVRAEVLPDWIVVKPIGPSKATYRDGRPRSWQPADGFPDVARRPARADHGQSENA